MSAPKSRVYVCDACKVEKREGSHWENNCHGGIMTIVPDGINGKYEFENLCPECRSVLHGAFKTALKSLLTDVEGSQPDTRGSIDG